MRCCFAIPRLAVNDPSWTREFLIGRRDRAKDNPAIASPAGYISLDTRACGPARMYGLTQHSKSPVVRSHRLAISGSIGGRHH